MSRVKRFALVAFFLTYSASMVQRTAAILAGEHLSAVSLILYWSNLAAVGWYVAVQMEQHKARIVRYIESPSVNPRFFVSFILAGLLAGWILRDALSTADPRWQRGAMLMLLAASVTSTIYNIEEGLREAGKEGEGEAP